jgi:NAD(P)-dependent dehydrogenase (short-subunit alcohol dehydrogenase family)
MSEKKVWFITGAGRGLGADIAKSALAAGHAVVATGRNTDTITTALGERNDVLAVPLDVTDPAAAERAVRAAVDRFGRIDVLVNNAGSFQAGFFEEISPEDFRAQIEITLFGPVNLTRVALPVMRAQRSGLVVTISSTAGISAAGDFMTAYAASKFGVEGFMESLTSEVAPFGIRTMLVEPGFFRTELLSPQSTQFAAASIADYAERTTATIEAWNGMDGQQSGGHHAGAAGRHQPRVTDASSHRAEPVKLLTGYGQECGGLGLVDRVHRARHERAHGAPRPA